MSQQQGRSENSSSKVKKWAAKQLLSMQLTSRKLFYERRMNLNV